MISAHYGLSDVFDNLIISLCKFTTLSSEVRFALLHGMLLTTLGFLFEVIYISVRVSPVERVTPWLVSLDVSVGEISLL